MSIQHKQISVETQDLGERVIRFIASNEEEDRDGDIMIAAGCDFKNYAKNPQFLGFHNYHDFPLGAPINWGIDHVGRKVYVDVRFPKLEELAERPECAAEKAKLVDFTYHCYKTKMLRAVSIGFDDVDTERNPKSKTPFGRIIKRWEMIELSAVPIPANPSALAESIKSYDPSGKLLDIFEPSHEEKAGRRISAATMKTIEDMKACHERIKGCHKEFDDLMTRLVNGTDDDETNDEPEEPVLEIDE